MLFKAKFYNFAKSFIAYSKIIANSVKYYTILIEKAYI